MSLFSFKRFGRKADPQATASPLTGMKMETVLLAAGSMGSYLTGQPELSGSARKDLARLETLEQKVEEAGIGFHRNCSPIELTFESDSQVQQLQPTLREMIEMINRITRTGRKAFKGNPKKVFEHLLCSVPNPGVYYCFNNLTEAPENVYCAHYGDMYIEDILDELPTLERYPNLQSLTFFSNDMGENDVSHIPFEKLQQIRHLEISANQLCDLWEEICRLPHLESLILFRNNLSRVWDYYGELKNLRYLQVGQNCFSEEELSKLKTLLPNCLIMAEDQREW